MSALAAGPLRAAVPGPALVAVAVAAALCIAAFGPPAAAASSFSSSSAAGQYGGTPPPSPSPSQAPDTRAPQPPGEGRPGKPRLVPVAAGPGAPAAVAPAAEPEGAGGGLPFTGAFVIPVLVLGALLVLVGAMLRRAGRSS